MKKLIYSAFAMSLTLISLEAFSQAESVDDFLGLEMEILPDLQGTQKFTPKDFHTNLPEWNVADTQVEMDKEPLKGQGYSMIPWSELDPENWLSIETWLHERKQKDKTPDWKVRLRDNSQTELMGKILQCRGKCFIYRGEKAVPVTHLSQVKEGDEIKTEKNTVAWVFLMDGTLMRLGPESSINMQEMNINADFVFYYARLNEGHVHWLPRRREVMAFQNEPETDSYSLPLLVRDANLGFYERQVYAKQSDKEYTSSLQELNDLSIRTQVEKLNNLWHQNYQRPMPYAKLLITTPNSSFVSNDSIFDLVYIPGHEAYIKQRPNQAGRIEFQPRGYLKGEFTAIETDKWHTVSVNGREITKNEDPSSDLQILELLTRRITTIELAREIWIEKFTLPIMSRIADSKGLAIEFGYSIWGGEVYQRIDFLQEYTRRTETTHLKSIENLMVKLEAAGKVMVKAPSDAAYKASLNHYLLGLKNRYSDKKMQVREMNDVQYYVWILKNGKL
jgi:hypothetical protein